MLLLLFVLLTPFTTDSYLTLREDLCYGGRYTLPLAIFGNRTVTYTPKVGEPKIVIKHGKSLDTRFKILWRGAEMSDVTEHDNDAILSSDTKFGVSLRIKNCHGSRRKRYGSFINWRIPLGAEYLEYVKCNDSDIMDPVEASILWNRTDPSRLRRGQINDDYYEIKAITQQDSGYYRFRGSKHQLVKWEQIIVENLEASFDFDEGDIKLKFPITFTPSQVKFKRGGIYNVPHTLSKDDNKFKITDRYFAIEGATPKDAGTYEFFDKDGNLMLRASVEIREVESVWMSYVILAAISFGGMLCCCCVKKCCCNESSDKSEETEDEAAASTVNHHNPAQSTQTVTPLLPRESRVIVPDLPTYSAAEGLMDLPPPYEECVTQPSAPLVPAYSSQPENPPFPAQPSANPPEPPTNDAILTVVNPSPPDEVSTAGPSGPTFFSSDNFNFTTSDSEPKFELSGTTFPSAPPLSSESTAIEYNSDRLNFL